MQRMFIDSYFYMQYVLEADSNFHIVYFTNFNFQSK